MIEITECEMKVLRVITGHIKKHGWPPTRSEIAQALGYRSNNAAECHVKSLARKGAIEAVPGVSRGIRVMAEPQ